MIKKTFFQSLGEGFGLSPAPQPWFFKLEVLEWSEEVALFKQVFVTTDFENVADAHLPAMMIVERR